MGLECLQSNNLIKEILTPWRWSGTPLFKFGRWAFNKEDLFHPLSSGFPRIHGHFYSSQSVLSAGIYL